MFTLLLCMYIEGDLVDETNLEYIGCVFYEERLFNHWQMQFFVFKDIDVYT